MNAKYSIGETVVIHCEALPHLHGTEHTITEISEVEFTGHGVTLLCYQLGFTFEWQGVKDYPYWIEECLRKKQKPSEFSFNSLMDNLKLPQSA